MTIEQLKKELGQYNPLLYQHELNTYFHSIRLMNSHATSGHGHELYVGMASDFLQWGIPDSVYDLICIGTVEDVHKIDNFEKCNLLVIPPSFSISSVMNDVLELMDAVDKYEKCSDLLLRSSMLLRGDSFDLNQVMDAAYELLGNPISICTSSGVIICHKHMEELNTTDGLLTFSDETLPSPSTKEIFLKISTLVDFNSAPVTFDYFINKQTTKNVVGKITDGQNSVAYFMLAEVSHKIEDSDINILKMVCDWLSSEYKKNPLILTPKQVMVSHFMSDLLNGTISNSNEIETRSERLCVGRKSKHCIVVFDIQQVDFQNTSPYTLRNILKSFLPESITLIFNGTIVFYLNWDGDLTLDSELNRAFWAFVKENRLRIGVSHSYAKMHDTNNAFSQALASIRLGKELYPQKALYYYHDFTLYHLLEQQQIQKGADLLSFCDPKLLDMVENEDPTNFEFVYTTYVLLQCGGKQTEASNMLHIHRSTMLYRIEKIVELTGWNFRDMSTMARLHISFAILVLTGKLDPEVYRI